MGFDQETGLWHAETSIDPQFEGPGSALGIMNAIRSNQNFGRQRGWEDDERQRKVAAERAAILLDMSKPGATAAFNTQGGRGVSTDMGLPEETAQDVEANQPGSRFRTLVGSPDFQWPEGTDPVVQAGLKSGASTPDQYDKGARARANTAQRVSKEKMEFFQKRLKDAFDRGLSPQAAAKDAMVAWAGISGKDEGDPEYESLATMVGRMSTEMAPTVKAKIDLEKADENLKGTKGKAIKDVTPSVIHKNEGAAAASNAAAGLSGAKKTKVETGATTEDPRKDERELAGLVAKRDAALRESENNYNPATKKRAKASAAEIQVQIDRVKARQAGGGADKTPKKFASRQAVIDDYKAKHKGAVPTDAMLDQAKAAGWY